MDEQKKQKVLLGSLAVLILGAGSAWYFTSGSDSGAKQAFSEGPVGRKVREQPEKAERKDTRREQRVRKTAVEQATERRERKTVDRATSDRKKRRRDDGKKEKKTVIAPAA